MGWELPELLLKALFSQGPSWELYWGLRNQLVRAEKKGNLDRCGQVELSFHKPTKPSGEHCF